MPDEEKVETTAQPEQQPVAETVKAEEAPKGPDGTPWDPDRAMETIQKLREEAKVADKLRKQVEAFEKAEQERKEAAMSELEKAQERAKEAEARAAALERKQLAREIADEVGLPVALADRLQGSTADEMKADAQALLESLPKSAKPQPNVSATNPGTNATGNETREQHDARIRETVFGVPVDPFSPDILRKQGGGVHWKTKD